VFHLEPVAAERLGDPPRGLDFLERGFGVGMDSMGEVDDLGPGRFDGRGKPLLRVDERAGGGRGDEGRQRGLLFDRSVKTIGEA
jgi:hypothetical protein